MSSPLNSFVAQLESRKEANEGFIPPQKLTEAEKIELYGSVAEWVRNTIMGFRRQYTHFQQQNPSASTRILDNYELLQGRFNTSMVDYIDKFNSYMGDEQRLPTAGKPKSPAKLHHYDILSTSIERIRGEEIKRPLDVRVVSTNMETISKKLDEKNERIREQIERDLVLALSRNPEVAPLVNPQAVEMASKVPVQSAQEIERDVNVSYKDKLEKYGDIALRYLWEQNNLRFKFLKGLDNLLCSYLDCYYVGKRYGEPYLRVVDSRYLEYDCSAETHFIEDASWACETRYISVNQVYDEYGEYLVEEDIDYLEQCKGKWFSVPEPVVTSNTAVKVVNYEWKTLRKVGHLTRHEEGEEDYVESIVDEYFPTKGWKKSTEYVNNAMREVHTSPKGETLVWYWVQEVWEAVQVNDDRVIHYQVKPNQYRSLSNPMEVKLGYCGVKVQYPLMERLKPYQMLYNIIMYRLELTIAKAKGQVGLFDIAQIPFSEGFNINRFMYYLETMGIAFVNSMEEGRGSQAGTTPRWSNFQTLDLSLANSIASYIAILDKLQLMAEESSGISKQSKGSISQYETAGGVSSAIQQSAYVTEHIFYLHSLARIRALKQLLDISTICWKDGKKGYYFLDDDVQRLFDIEGQVYSLAEFDLHLSNHAKYEKISQFLEANALAALQNDQLQLSDVVAVLEADSVNHKKIILELAKEARKAMMQEQASEQASQLQQELQARQMELEAKMQMNREDNETKLKVAEIAANAKIKDDLRNSKEYVAAEQQFKEAKLREEMEQREKDRQLEREKLETEAELKNKELKLKP
jgi:hypothetical protein